MNPSSAALLLLVDSVLIALGGYIGLTSLSAPLLTKNLKLTQRATTPNAFLVGKCLNTEPGSMSDPVYRFSSPVQMLRQIHSHQKVSVIYDLVDTKRRCMGSLFIHHTSPPHSSHDETAPLLGPPSKPDTSACRSHATQPDDFRPIRLISQGVSGKVYLVEDKVTKKNFALKVIRKRIDSASHYIVRICGATSTFAVATYLSNSLASTCPN